MNTPHRFSHYAKQLGKRVLGLTPPSDLVARIDGIDQRLAQVEAALVGGPEREATLRKLEERCSQLEGTVDGALRQIHLDHGQITELDWSLQRVAGTVLDQVALERRLARIENRLSAAHFDEVPEDGQVAT